MLLNCYQCCLGLNGPMIKDCSAPMHLDREPNGSLWRAKWSILNWSRRRAEPVLGRNDWKQSLGANDVGNCCYPHHFGSCMSLPISRVCSQSLMILGQVAMKTEWY